MDKFSSDGIVTDMHLKIPSSLLHVKYGRIELQPGSILAPTQVKDQPTVEWTADANAFYTIIMNDLDVPSRAEPKFREAYHWGVVNIPGNDVSKGQVLTEYLGSGPPQGTGLHRYVFFVFKQAGQQAFDEKHISKCSREGRALHSVAKFAEKHSLGDPVAGNYYLAEWDDYVPTLHAQLGIN
jgi:phosphatidylethanolamine-binding protein (PEBP) family uncharacterized protein